ncbi:MAG: MFS transporter [Deltaproteobacteria bacterium CG1_02_45_11]|nr:MAG: MFS transporter [Deltaproteobacteria bacterium CG1_02_45_11]
MEKLNKKVFAVLFFSIFASITGVGIVVPLLPVYAHDLGAGGLYIGFIFGAVSLSRTFLLPYFGRLSDRKGRKPFIVAGLLGYALISIGFLFANNIGALIGVRFIQGIASAMIMPVALAYVGDITPAGREGFVMGLFNMSLFIGLSVGPLGGGVINDCFSLQTAFVCMGFLALVGFLLALFLLPPTKSEQVVCRKSYPAAWKRILKDRVITGLILFRLSYTVCIGIIWGFLPVLADSEFSLSSSLIGLLVMLGVFISGMIHVPMGFLADRVNKKMMIVIGGLVVTCSMFSYEWANSFKDLLLASFFFGIGGGISMPALMALAVLKGDKAEAMGSVMALITMAHSMGILIGVLIAGLMMDIFQLRYAFPAGAIIMALGVGLFLVCTHYQEERRPRQI